MRVIDVHTHVWLGRAEDRRELIDALERVPLERVYVSGIKEELPEPDVVTAVNDAVHVLLKEESKARGFVYLNPRHGEEALGELDRCVGLGFVGVKLWIATQADDPLNFPVYEAAVRHDLPVLLHCFDKAGGPPSPRLRAAKPSVASAKEGGIASGGWAASSEMVGSTAASSCAALAPRRSCWEPSRWGCWSWACWAT